MTEAHEDHNHGFAHAMSPVILLGVFGALIFLTVVTVFLARNPIIPPGFDIIIAMTIATIKASLVVLFFMHLIHDTKFNVLLFLASFWFIAVFFIFTFFDLSSRDRIMKSSGSFEFRKDKAEDIVVEKPSLPNG